MGQVEKIGKRGKSTIIWQCRREDKELVEIILADIEMGHVRITGSGDSATGNGLGEQQAARRQRTLKQTSDDGFIYYDPSGPLAADDNLLDDGHNRPGPGKRPVQDVQLLIAKTSKNLRNDNALVLGGLPSAAAALPRTFSSPGISPAVARTRPAMDMNGHELEAYLVEDGHLPSRMLKPLREDPDDETSALLDAATLSAMTEEQLSRMCNNNITAVRVYTSISKLLGRAVPASSSSLPLPSPPVTSHGPPAVLSTALLTPQAAQIADASG